MGFDCYTIDLVSRWGPINVVKWADNVIPPNDMAAIEGMSDEKLLEGTTLYTYQACVSDSLSSSPMILGRHTARSTCSTLRLAQPLMHGPYLYVVHWQ